MCTSATGAQTGTSRRTTSRLCSSAMDVHVRYWSSDWHIAAHYITSVFIGHGCARPLLELRLAHRGALHHVCVHGPWMCMSATGAQTVTSRRTTSRLCSWAMDVHVRYWSSDCHTAAHYITSVFMGHGCARPLLELRLPHRGALHHVCVHGPWMCTSATGAQTATSRHTTSRLCSWAVGVHVRYWSSDCHIAAHYITSVFMGRGRARPLLELRLPHRGPLHNVCVHGPWACTSATGAQTATSRRTTSRLCSWAVGVHVRSWSSDCNIAAHYITSVFMGRGRADDLLEHFLGATEEHGHGRASLHGCELVVSRYGSKEIKARLQLPVVACWVMRPPHCSWCVQAWSGGQQVGDRIFHAVGVLNLQRDPCPP